MAKKKLKKYRGAILREYPQLAEAKFSRLNDGWDSVAIDVDDRLIFKFPRTKVAAQALTREAAILTALRPALTLTVPDLSLCAGPPLFSRHAKLSGIQIEPDVYAALPDTAREKLAADLARFYAELHAIAPELMRAADATAISPWHIPKTVRKKALPLLPRKLRGFARDIIKAYTALPPDPYGTIFGYFDGHGWNMAFDAQRQELSGLYDFADAGFGPLHQDFVALGFVSPDLTQRIISNYETLTGRHLDRARIDILTGYHHLSELADFAADRDRAKDISEDFALWADQRGVFGRDISR